MLSIIVLMKKVYDFFKVHKYAFFWTIGYVCVMWAILYFLFNFDMFNMAQWHRLMRAHLHGFAGFVFGLLILAAMPLYVATTAIIIKKKKPLITIPVPKVNLQAIFKKAPEPEPVKATEEEKKEPENPEMNLPAELPLEMKPIFLRAKQNLLLMQQVGFVPPDGADAVEHQGADVVDSLPVPSDFDIDFSDEDSDEENEEFTTPLFDGEAPVFKSLSFDADNDSENVSGADLAGDLVDNSKLLKYLSDAKRDFSTDEDVVLTDKFAIVTHSDSDFWVADNENWFAAGKVCESPIIVAKRTAEKHGLIPAIYLQEKNILNIDDLIGQWQKDGVIVITNLSEV